jgi:adenylate kinase
MRLILLGLPGAGKGTQAAAIAERHGLLHVSTGDMFREAAAEGTELGQRAQGYMSRGELVPDELTIEMLLGRIIARPDADAGFMLDGFPRTIAQAEALDAALGERDCAIDAVLYIRVPEEELMERLAGRWTCPGCGAIYHAQHSPPKVDGRCDDCGSELTQRADDRPETVQQRLNVNREWTEALAGYYERTGKLTSVDGAGAPDEVTGRLFEALSAVPATARRA